MTKIDKRDILSTSIRNVEELKRRYNLEKENEIDLSNYLSSDIFPLPLANGGTGAAITELAPNDILIGGSTNAFIKANLFNLIYPVGSVYISTNSTSPQTLFGGTWVQIKDVFLLSAGDTYSAGTTGGESTHKLTANEMPSHTHSVTYDRTDGHYSGNSTEIRFNGDYSGNIGYTGGGEAHNNMPPYFVVYMWRRTA